MFIFHSNSSSLHSYVLLSLLNKKNTGCCVNKMYVFVAEKLLYITREEKKSFQNPKVSEMSVESDDDKT